MYNSLLEDSIASFNHIYYHTSMAMIIILAQDFTQGVTNGSEYVSDLEDPVFDSLLSTVSVKISPSHPLLVLLLLLITHYVGYI